MTDLEHKIAELNDLILKGDTLRALEIFYADTVVMQENEELPRIGKASCLENERGNLSNIKEFTYKLLNQAIDVKNNVVFSEWVINFTTNSDKKMKITEVSVQNWADGQIIREKFYYKDFYPVT